MKPKHFLVAAMMALATNFACAQKQFRIQETFYEGEVFEAVVTFSTDYTSIISVNGVLSNPLTSAPQKYVTGLNEFSYRSLGATIKQVSLTGPDGFPFGYLLSLSWDYGHAPNMSLPIFVTDRVVIDESTGQVDYYYSNSINGLNYATSASITAVPEPANYAMLLGGLVLFVGLRRRTPRD
jgi:hypothetical protein